MSDTPIFDQTREALKMGVPDPNDPLDLTGDDEKIEQTAKGEGLDGDLPDPPQDPDWIPDEEDSDADS